MGARERKPSRESGPYGAELETEVKVFEVPKNIEAKLRASGARRAFQGEIETVRFDTPDRAAKAVGLGIRIRKITDRTGLFEKTYYQWGVKFKAPDAILAADPDAKIQWEIDSRLPGFKNFEKAHADLMNKLWDIIGEINKSHIRAEPPRPAIDTLAIVTGLKEFRRTVKKRVSYEYPPKKKQKASGAKVDLDTLMQVQMPGEDMRTVTVPRFAEIEGDKTQREGVLSALGLSLNTVDSGESKMSEGDVLKHYNAIRR